VRSVHLFERRLVRPFALSDKASRSMAVDKTAGITVNFCSLVGFGKWLKNNGFFDLEWVGLDRAFLFIDGKLIGPVESHCKKGFLSTP